MRMHDLRDAVTLSTSGRKPVKTFLFVLRAGPVSRYQLKYKNISRYRESYILPLRDHESIRTFRRVQRRNHATESH